MVTINMIKEYLHGCTLIQTPGHRSQGFDELITLDDEYFQNTYHSPQMNLESILFCGQPEHIHAIKELMPDAWTFCVFPPDTKPVPVDQLRNHAIACYSDLSYDAVCSKLVRIFSAVCSWTQRMKAIILEDGSYQGLLNISAPILKNFISISDSQFRLLAYTSDVDIDDPVTLRILELGYHPEETIDLFRQYGIMRDWEKQTKIEKRRTTFTKYPTMDYVFRMQGNYFMHVVMQCNNVEPTPAYIDAFQLLIDHIGFCAKQDFSQKYLLTDEPSTLFADLITKRLTSDDRVTTRMDRAGIPHTGTYRLVGFNFNQQPGASQLLSYYAQHVKDTFPNTFVGIFDQTVLLLDPFPNEISDHQSRLLTFLNAHPCVLGVSRVFSDIKDFAFAFQEVMITIDMSTSNLPVLAQYYERGGSPINFFENLFPVYVANEAKAGNALLEYIANTGIVAQIAKYDEQHNSNDLYILYWYLANERKAKPTCDRLFIHRNTLMYRINSMQERFGFDLDDAHTRMSLLMEFLLKPHA